MVREPGTEGMSVPVHRGQKLLGVRRDTRHLRVNRQLPYGGSALEARAATNAHAIALIYTGLVGP
jgi:hypothetical protein